VALAHLVLAAASVLRQTDMPLAVSVAQQLRRPFPFARRDLKDSLPALEALPGALKRVEPETLAALLQSGADALPWTSGSYDLPASIAENSAFAELVGPDGSFRSSDLRFGFFLQAPNCLYPPHHHAAEELYYVLSGSAAWQKDTGRFTIRPPGTLIHHLPWQNHAMRTGDEALFAMWAWVGDLRTETYRLCI
jgi:mannose-6-phosphate isomerase-like protein (cupin superfamily)